MYRYVIKRLLLMIPIVIGTAFIIYGIICAIPGDPGRIILGVTATEEQVRELNEQLGVNLPFFQRFFNYMVNVFTHFDLGTSYLTGVPVLEEIGRRLPCTLILAFGATILSLLIGLPVGVLSAVKQYSLLDVIPSAIALLLACIPSFVIAMVLLLVFALNLHWFPATGIGTIRHYILPILALGLPYAGIQMRFTRSTMLETIRQDYVRTARAKGAPKRDVIWKHAMKNALLPIITIAGTNFGGLLGGAVTLEIIFGMQGIGSYVVTSILGRDAPAVTGAIIVFVLMFSVVMLILDIVYSFIDPRIRAKYTARKAQ